MVQLLDEQRFMAKRKAAEYVVEPLQIQQQMEKAKACAKILEEINEESK